MYIIDGKQLASQVKQDIKELASSCTKNKDYSVPRLAMIVVGDNPASATYVRNKKKSLEEVGFEYQEFHLEENVTEDEVIKLIESINQNPEFHGLFVQFPLPQHLNEQHIASFISPIKDVDGFTAPNVASGVNGTAGLLPCTAVGCEIMIQHASEKLHGKKLQGAHVVIIGRSEIVGKPLSHLLTNKDYTITVCHSKTPKDVLKSLCLHADIIVVAVGRPRLLTADMVKPGAIVIDVGINFEMVDGKRKMIGDVDFENVKEVAGAVTPVPGGVGPMTVACLVQNLYHAYVLQTL